MAKDTQASRLLLQARSEAGLKQSELARRAGMPHSVVSAYENGRREPGIERLAKLLSAAGFELALERQTPTGVDLERSADHLEQALDLSDHLPQSWPGPLTYPFLPHRDRR